MTLDIMENLINAWYWRCYHADCKLDFMELEYGMNEMYCNKRITYDVYKDMKATYNYYKNNYYKRLFDITETRKKAELD